MQIIFGSNSKLKKSQKFRVVVGDTEVLAKDSVPNLGCILDSRLARESTALKVISKINEKLDFLQRY